MPICPQRWVLTFRIGQSFGQRMRRGRGDDPVALWHQHERGCVDVPRYDIGVPDAPCVPVRGVAAIPAAHAFMRDRSGERHPVIEPVFQRDEVLCRLACRVGSGEVDELSGHEERVEG